MEEKILCTDGGCNQALLSSILANQGRNTTDLMAMMNSGGFGGGNSLIWIIWLLIFGQNGFGMNRGNALQDNEIMNRINSIQAQLSANQNSNLLMDGINKVPAAINDLAGIFNCSFSQMQSAMANLNTSLAVIGGKMDTNREAVLNGILMGNKDMISALQSCCNQTQQSIIREGYENRLSTQAQTNALQGEMAAIGSQIQQQFCNLAYETQRQTCDIINANAANTQKIIDQMNAQKYAELSNALQDEKFKNSQLVQNQYIVDQIKSAVGSLNLGGCGCGR